MRWLDPDLVEVGNALCAATPRLEQKGLDFPLARDWTQKWPMETQTLRVPKEDQNREHKGGLAGAVEGRQTHLQGPAGKEKGAVPASYRGWGGKWGRRGLSGNLIYDLNMLSLVPVRYENQI